MPRTIFIVFIAIGVGCNAAPEAPLVTITPSEPTTVDDLVAEIDGDYTDADGDPVDYSTTWYRDGVAQPQFTELGIPASETKKGQRWKLFVQPSDGKIEGPPSEAEVTVLNTPPVVTELSLTPDEVGESDPISATAVAQDDDDDNFVFRYSWSVDGQIVLDGSQSWIDGEHFDKHDEVTVRVTANDGEEDGEPLEATPVTVRNTAPSITGAVVVPEAIYEATPAVTCLGEGWEDVDGDPEGYRVTWEVNGAAVSTAEVLDGSLFDKHDNIRCSLVPDDGEDQGDEKSSDVVAVLNTAPRVEAVALSDSAPTTTTDITVSFSPLDDDGDDLTYSYAWYVEGVLVHAEERVSTPTSTLASSLFVKHEEIYVQVTPHDDETDGVSEPSDVATAVNTLPVIDSLALSHTTLFTDDVISANVVTSDADGDEVTLAYAWTVDGVSAGVDSSSLAGQEWFDKEQEVQVTVTAEDTDGGTDMVTSLSVEVLNSPPTAPELSIDPEVPEAEVDDLLCSIEIDSVDVDGDDFSYTLAWDVDGVAYAAATTTFVTGDTVPGEDTEDGQVWTCTVTATDIVGDSSASDVSVPTEYIVDPEISCGSAHCCYLDRYGDLTCWGSNYYNQTTIPSDFFAVMGTGRYHTCVVDGSGQTECYGLDTDGQSSPPTALMVALAGGYTHSCGIDTSGQVHCWGSDDYGESTPPTGSYTQIGLGNDYSCALDTAGGVDCWGDDSLGQATPPIGTFTVLAVGNYNACVIDTSGALECWGYNSSASLNTPPTGTYSVVDSGRYHACAIDTSSALTCWGYDNYGYGTLGFPSGAFVDLGTGSFNTCAVDAAGEITCWGSNIAGESSPPSSIAAP